MGEKGKNKKTGRSPVPTEATLLHSSTVCVPLCVPSLPTTTRRRWQMICTCGNGTPAPLTLGKMAASVWGGRGRGGRWSIPCVRSSLACLLGWQSSLARRCVQEALNPGSPMKQRRRRTGKQQLQWGFTRKHLCKAYSVYEMVRRHWEAGEEALLLAERNPREGGRWSLLPSVPGHTVV